jgi:CMP-N,N'-diacetyllegionaminic acid synthase
LTFYALIPCRTGSQGIPMKNFQLLKGKSLWLWTFEAAMDTREIDRVIVSSNGGLPMHSMNGKRAVFDNECLSPYHTNESQLDPLIQRYAELYPEADAWVLLQPTSPLRKADDIKKACSLYSNGYDSLVSVEDVGDKFWRHGEALYNYYQRKNRQNVTDSIKYENGAIYICSRDLIQKGSRIGGRVALFEMSKDSSYQIDDMTDWKICEVLL